MRVLLCSPLKVHAVQDFDGFVKLIIGFAGIAVPAAIVNAGLKYISAQPDIVFVGSPPD